MYIGQRCLSPLQSRYLGTSHSSSNCNQLPCHIFLNLISGLISPFLKVILVLRKVRSHRAPNLGCRGTESPGWFDVSPKNCSRHDAWVGMLSWWSFQSPVVHSCCLLNQSNSLCRGMFKLNAKFDADSLLYLLSHFECDGHTVHIHAQSIASTTPLTSRSRHCSCMCIPVHSPWLPGYISFV